MPDSFEFTIPKPSLTLGEDRADSVVIDVTSRLGRHGLVGVEVVAGEGADEAWFGQPEPNEFDLPSGETLRSTIPVNVPADATAGDYSFELRAYAVDNPQQDFTNSPSIAMAVSEPKAPAGIPSWIFILIATLVVLVLVLALYLLFFRKGDDPVTMPVTTLSLPKAPDLIIPATTTTTTTTTTATAAPMLALEMVAVGAPAINCVFDTDCTIVVDDDTDSVEIPAGTGSGFLQSRRFPVGEPGTQAAGLNPYSYRLDLRNIGPVGNANGCIFLLRLPFGPSERLDFDGDGALDDAYIVTSGGIGDYGPTSARRDGMDIVFAWDDGLCPGSTSYFFGVTANRSDHAADATLTGNVPAGDGFVLDVSSRVPERQ